MCLDEIKCSYVFRESFFTGKGYNSKFFNLSPDYSFLGVKILKVSNTLVKSLDAFLLLNHEFVLQSKMYDCDINVAEPIGVFDVKNWVTDFLILNLLCN